MNSDTYPIDLAPLHTFRLPAKGRELLRLNDEFQCQNLPSDNNYYVIGGGSNLVFTENYDRPLIKVEIKGVDFTESDTHWLITSGAGENWHEFVMKCLDRDINGLENLALIPGTVGAAPVQNIGAYGVEIEAYIDSVRAWDRAQQGFSMLTREECNFAYRDSLFKQQPQRYLITKVFFKIPKQWQPVLTYGPLQSIPVDASAKYIAAKVIEIRKSKLPEPAKIPNAGSFFKNPIISAEQHADLISALPDLPSYNAGEQGVKISAAYLIDRLGFKGFELQGAAVHLQQPLVLVNTGNATGADLLTLAKTIQSKVLAHYGVTLEVEVRLLGNCGLVEL